MKLFNFHNSTQRTQILELSSILIQRKFQFINRNLYLCSIYVDLNIDMRIIRYNDKSYQFDLYLSTLQKIHKNALKIYLYIIA